MSSRGRERERARKGIKLVAALCSLIAYDTPGVGDDTRFTIIMLTVTSHHTLSYPQELHFSEMGEPAIDASGDGELRLSVLLSPPSCISDTSVMIATI